MNSEEKTILLVEDEAIVCENQADILKQGGYRVITAMNGEMAIDRFKKGNKIDLVLMDIDLGKGMDGIQAARIILHDHDIPLIFLSGHTEKEIIKKTDTITSYGFVFKNSGEHALFTTIKMAFRLFFMCKENMQKTEVLADSELRYRRLFESAQDGIFLLNADSGEIMDVNPYLMDLIGYTYDELIGKQLWEISPFHDIAENKTTFIELQKQGYAHYENLPLLHKSGIVKHVEFVSNFYTVKKSQIIQCNIRDIEKRKEIEDAKEVVLTGKATMLRELQHRIKNSLSIIASLINMEAYRSTNPEIKEMLSKIRNRINSMSNLYDLLSTSQNASEIQLNQYIERIVDSLFKSYLKENRKIDLEMHLDKILIDVDIALSIGLILNELITNTLKYAFPNDRSGSIRIVLSRKKDTVTIEVEDDGVGIPSGVTDNSSGLGMLLVQLLSEQINGSFEKVAIDKGSLFQITFPG